MTATQIKVGYRIYATQQAAESALGLEMDDVVARRYMTARDDAHRAELDGMAAESLHNARRIAAALEAQVDGYSAQEALMKKFTAKVEEYRRSPYYTIPDNATL